MKNVTVICSPVLNSLGLVRTLGEVGYNVECICYGDNVRYILGSKYVSKGIGFKTCEDAVKYLVNDYPSKKEKPVLFTIPDPPAYYVDINQNALKDKFIIFNAGKPGNVVFWMDKQNISDLARKHGLNVPWTIKLSKNEPVPNDLNFPVFIKSAKSTEGGKVDEGICNSKEELDKKIKGLVSEEYIIMQYIRKIKEINYFGIAIKNHVYIDYHDVRTRCPKDGYGYYNSFHLCEYDDLHHRMTEMIKETQYQGLFDVEFLVDENGEMFFTEVNFRVDGEIYKLASGINLPDYWCKLIDVPEEELPVKLETHKKSFVGMDELGDFKVSVLSGKVNIFLWLWQFFSADRRMLCNIKDPKPVFIKTVDLIKRFL